LNENYRAIANIQTITEGHGIRTGIHQTNYGDGNWKKKKGVAMVELETGMAPKPRFIGMRLMA